MHIIDHFTLQYYSTKAIPTKYKRQLCRICVLSHNLATEHGRHANTPTNNLYCEFCHLDVEDEFHFVLKCPHVHNISCKYIKKYNWKEVSILNIF